MNTSVIFPVSAILLVGPTGSGKSPLDEVLVLNGIPRHEGRAKDVASIATVHAVMVLNCSIESVMQGIEENTGGDRTRRVDDDQALLEKKHRIFEELTAPLIEHYRKAGSRTYRIDISERTTTGSAYHRLSTLAAADPPVAFVAEPPQG